MPVASLEDHDLDALLGKFVAERAAARTRADDDDESVVVDVEFCHGVLPQLSQSMSLKPRLMYPPCSADEPSYPNFGHTS